MSAVLPLPAQAHVRRWTARRLAPWLLIGGPILVFSLWALFDNGRLFLVTLLLPCVLVPLGRRWQAAARLGPVA